MTFKMLFFDRALLQQIAYLMNAACKEMTLEEAQLGKGLEISCAGDFAAVIHSTLKLLEAGTNSPENSCRIVAAMVLEKFDAAEGPKLDAKRTRSLDGSDP